ncbi:transmembrane protein, putative (macronuclear) [Tetrahymena thermophila SB210]|uniref:Transmembrane protein, putative n=1 Tax=Tetrahymena thermophila (strain SB210) TaxID=312017 RepID=W7XL28_TETTS|nr:transmembrane protein, putative [Tetrahymena thermophila SB210]EWS75564.1 transmembrane protein, putative [Tetrahymena thermophila SB210]|eukprot:XP_012651864.1 transmembrane protein, putative [Tetrahymena thermophila SB210]
MMIQCIVKESLGLMILSAKMFIFKNTRSAFKNKYTIKHAKQQQKNNIQNFSFIQVLMLLIVCLFVYLFLLPKINCNFYKYFLIILKGKDEKELEGMKQFLTCVPQLKIRQIVLKIINQIRKFVKDDLTFIQTQNIVITLCQNEQNRLLIKTFIKNIKGINEGKYIMQKASILCKCKNYNFKKYCQLVLFYIQLYILSINLFSSLLRIYLFTNNPTKQLTN